MRGLRVCMLAAATLVALPAGADERVDRVDRLIEDFRDDDVRGNAGGACQDLLRVPEPAIDELHAALDSDDWQQRQLAAHVLWQYSEPSYWSDFPEWRRSPQPVLTQRLFEVTVEGLRDDESVRPVDEERGALALYNASNGFRRLVPHAQLAKDALLEGLESDDLQQRLLCALILGTGGVGETADRVVPILVPHLADNTIEGDAKWTSRALFMLGERAIPALEAAREASTDRQQSDLLNLILLNLRGAPASPAEVEARRRLNTITGLTHDPTQFDFSRYTMWWLRTLPEQGSPAE